MNSTESTTSLAREAPEDLEGAASDAAERRLLDKAIKFATDLSETVCALCPSVAPFEAQIAIGKSRSRIAVSQQPPSGIPLLIGGVPRLSLKVEFMCVADHADAYLAVEEAKIKVYATDGGGEPLFRYEFLREPIGGIPGAHLQIHAHRDAYTFLMAVSGDGSPRGRRRKKAVHRQGSLPTMSELHFPLGGPRFRPCLEDVLQMLVDEFGVDVPDGALVALAAGREAWRRDQLGAAVRDSPEKAASVLVELGYSVQPPNDGHKPDRPDKLRAY